jgi:hypothetical protein
MIMKKYIANALLVLTAGFVLSSCMKDTEPTGVITQEQLAEVIQAHPEKFEATITGIYSDIQSWSNPGLSHNYFGLMSFYYLSSLEGMMK